MSIKHFGVFRSPAEFPTIEEAHSKLEDADIGIAKDAVADYNYFLTNNMSSWIRVYLDPESLEGSWEMVIDDFENGWGNRLYPRCSKCYKGVYKHDAGKYCPFCGSKMKNPMV